MATYPHKQVCKCSIYLESVLNFFSKTLVFAVAKCPIIVGGFFETFIFWNLVSLDIWGDFSAHPELLDFRVLVIYEKVPLYAAIFLSELEKI